MTEKRKAESASEALSSPKVARADSAQPSSGKTDETTPPQAAGDGAGGEKGEAAANTAEPAQAKAPDPALTLEKPAADAGTSLAVVGPRVTEDEMCAPNPVLVLVDL